MAALKSDRTGRSRYDAGSLTQFAAWVAAVGRDSGWNWSAGSRDRRTLVSAGNFVEFEPVGAGSVFGAVSVATIAASGSVAASGFKCVWVGLHRAGCVLERQTVLAVERQK